MKRAVVIFSLIVLGILPTPSAGADHIAGITYPTTFTPRCSGQTNMAGPLTEGVTYVIFGSAQGGGTDTWIGIYEAATSGGGATFRGGLKRSGVIHEQTATGSTIAFHTQVNYTGTAHAGSLYYTPGPSSGKYISLSTPTSGGSNTTEGHIRGYATTLAPSFTFTSCSGATVGYLFAPGDITSAPSAPQNVAAEYNATACAIDVEWEAPASDGGSAITFYHVYRSEVEGDLGTSISTVTGSQFATSDYPFAIGIEPPTRGVPLYYTVKAENSEGVGPGSSPQATATLAEDCAAEIVLEAEPMRHKVKLSWEASGSLASTITHYDIFRSCEEEDPCAVAYNVPKRLGIYYDSDFNSSSYCQVVAYEVRGNLSGSPFPVVSNTALAIAEEAPELSQFGEDGALFGARAVECSMPPEPVVGDPALPGYIEGGRDALGEATGVPGEAIAWMFGVIFVLLFTFMGYQLAEGGGAAMGAVVGLVFAVAAAFVPVWLVVLFVAVGVLGFLYVRGRGAGGGA